MEEMAAGIGDAELLTGEKAPPEAEASYVRCLMVESGQENIVRQLLRVRRLGKGLYPQRVRIRQIRKKWRADRVRLLPGYLFVYTREEIPVWQYQGLEHVLKVLRYEREPHGYLRGNDLEFARTIAEMDGKIDVLDAVEGEDGFVHITDSLMKLLHGEVLSLDKRQRLVKIRIELLGQTREVYMNYQLLGTDGKPLNPVEEMVQDWSDDWLTAWTPDFADEADERLDREMADGDEPDRGWEDQEPENQGELTLADLDREGYAAEDSNLAALLEEEREGEENP